MQNFSLLASPWWVNLFILIPFLAYFFWKGRLDISRRILLWTGVFGIFFGLVEAAVVIYLRSATGFLGLQNGILLSTVNFQSFYQKPEALGQLPDFLFSIELYRETATIAMLVAVAFLSVLSLRERFAIFLWSFAFWDIFYYVFLWLAIRWPSSPTDPDILFLIPSPWFSQVWYPMLLSTLLIIAVLLGSKKQKI